MTPRVSILLPVWNAGKTLAICLRNLERQRESGWECVLVDDGSSDDSLAVARDFAARDPRFRVTLRPHEGLVATLNAGAEACRAHYLSRDFLRDAREYVLWGHGPTARALRRALEALGYRDGTDFVCAA